jgi:hypothetical protein
MDHNEQDQPKVKVAARRDVMSSDAPILLGLILLVVVNAVVLLGRSAGGM